MLTGIVNKGSLPTLKRNRLKCWKRRVYSVKDGVPTTYP
jgi:hypothetical protein